MITCPHQVKDHVQTCRHLFFTVEPRCKKNEGEKRTWESAISKTNILFPYFLTAKKGAVFKKVKCLTCYTGCFCFFEIFHSNFRRKVQCHEIVNGGIRVHQFGLSTKKIFQKNPKRRVVTGYCIFSGVIVIFTLKKSF